MAVNEWSVRYGAIRRAKDHALLTQLEKQIAAEEKAAKTAATPGAINPVHRRSTAAGSAVDRDDERKRIALAFGRPFA